MSRPMKARRAAAFLFAVIALFALPMKASATPQIVYRHASRNGQKRVALTFDDGPHPRYTPEILDILAEYGVEATFFAVGSNAELYPHIIKQLLFHISLRNRLCIFKNAIRKRRFSVVDMRNYRKISNLALFVILVGHEN